MPPPLLIFNQCTTATPAGAAAGRGCCLQPPCRSARLLRQPRSCRACRRPGLAGAQPAGPGAGPGPAGAAAAGPGAPGGGVGWGLERAGGSVLGGAGYTASACAARLEGMGDKAATIGNTSMLRKRAKRLAVGIPRRLARPGTSSMPHLQALQAENQQLWRMVEGHLAHAAPGASGHGAGALSALSRQAELASKLAAAQVGRTNAGFVLPPACRVVVPRELVFNGARCAPRTRITEACSTAPLPTGHHRAAAAAGGCADPGAAHAAAAAAQHAREQQRLAGRRRQLG